MKKILNRNETAVVVVILLFSIIITSINREFLTTANMVDMVRSMIIMTMFACACLIVIVSGGVDVSFPAIASFAMYCTVKILMHAAPNAPIGVAYIIAAAIGLLLGLINGFLIGVCKLPTLIATLGTSSMVSGFMLSFIGSVEISNLPKSIDSFAQVSLLTFQSAQGTKSSIPATVIFPIAICVVIAIILRYTMVGRSIVALGGDAVAAQRAGFDVVKTQFIIYAIVGLVCGIAGMTQTVLMRNCSPTTLMGAEMLVIAAVVIGGARITGGHGTVVGAILGVTLVVLMTNNLVLIRIPSYFQQLVVGLLIIVGTGMTSLRVKLKNKS